MKKLERNSPAEEKALKAAMAADPNTWEATEAEFASARPTAARLCLLPNLI